MIVTNFTGPKPGLGNWWTPKELSWDISTGLPGPTSTEEVMLSVPQGLASPVADWEQGRDAHTAEDSSLHTPNPHVEQEELPLVGSAPGGYVLVCFRSAGTHSLACALEADGWASFLPINLVSIYNNA